MSDPNYSAYSRRPAVGHHVAIQPVELTAVADQLKSLAHSLKQSATILEQVAVGLRLHPGDPSFDPMASRRQLAEQTNLLAATAEQSRTDSEICRVTANQAIAADQVTTADASPICRWPQQHRGPVDQTLTRVIGGGIAYALEAAVTGVDWTLRRAEDLGLRDRPEGSGDWGGTFTTRTINVDKVGETNVVTLALRATGDQRLLAHDEFGLIDHGHDRYTVVLPGVVDLSAPRRGWDPGHRSVRDLDEAAIESARTDGVDNNAYAQLVIEALDHYGIESGANLVLIGHSFGADTALDLATDHDFTNRYQVRHVVAAGYNSLPQSGLLPDGVDLVVLRNRWDLVVAAETLLPTTAEGVFRLRSTERQQRRFCRHVQRGNVEARSRC